MAEAQDYNTVQPTRGSTLSTSSNVRTYRDLGRHSALIMVLVLNVIEAVCLALTFAFPIFQRTPYGDYTINYYWKYAEYDDYGDFDGTTVDFEDCGDISSDKNCTTLQNSGENSYNLTIVSLIFLILTTLIILQRVCKTYPKFTNLFLLLNLIISFLVYILSFSSLFQFAINWPYTKFCSYKGDNTGCQWFVGIHVLIVAMSLNIITLMILISMLTPICLLFCPKLRPNEANLPIYSRNPAPSTSANTGAIAANDNKSDNEDDDDDDDDNDSAPIPNSVRNTGNNAGNPERRRKLGCFISLAEWLSIIVLCLIFAFLNVIICVLLIDQWQNASKDSQSHVDDSWTNAQCVNHTGYFSTPIVLGSNVSHSCGFEFPDDDSENTYFHTNWTCCEADTCNIAYDYTSLFINYDSDDSECKTDMKALTKASCHPNNKWFSGTKYDIRLSPQQRLNKTQHNLNQENTIVLCSLFCGEIWDHCQGMTLASTTNKTVSDVYSNDIDFCVNGLAMAIRREAFTDECFAGCPTLSVKNVLLFVMIMVLVRFGDAM